MRGRDAHVHLDPQEIRKWNPHLLFRIMGNTRESMLHIPNAHYPRELWIEHPVKEKECQVETNVNAAGLAPRWTSAWPRDTGGVSAFRA